MPLKGGNLGDLDEDPVTRTVVELGRFSDLETSDPAWERNALGNCCCPSAKKSRDCPVGEFNAPDAAKGNEPLPEVRGVEEEQEEVEDIVEVGEVEDEEVSAPPHRGHAAADHDGEDDDESNPSWVCRPTHRAKDSYIMRFLLPGVNNRQFKFNGKKSRTDIYNAGCHKSDK